MIAHHALVLNLHQPAGNLQELLDQDNWEAREILFALDRMPRLLWGQEDLARVHLSLSGTLLETLADPVFQERVYGIVDLGSLLWHFQNQRIFEVLGTGYYHPVLPLIPEADRREHLGRWLGIAHHLLWRPRFQGFWPPEMGFCMELIPLLREFGYRYVLVDSEHIEPLGEMTWQEMRYRPHLARHGDATITVVVRDRELSDAQESGMDLDWFVNEVAERTKWCDFPPLVTTCTDGENGGWFRNVTEGANFWSAFYLPLLERARAGTVAIEPTFISDYLERHGAYGEVRVRTGAWNTGWHHGRDFTQWTGSQRQRDAIAALAAASREVHDTRWSAGERGLASGQVATDLDAALWRLLRAQTSCNLYWGEAWVPRLESDLAASRAALERARQAEPRLNPDRETPPIPAPDAAPGSAATPAPAAPDPSHPTAMAEPTSAPRVLKQSIVEPLPVADPRPPRSA